MDLSEREDFLGRWVNNQLSKEELESFEQSADYEVYRRILDTAEDLEAPTFNVESGLKAVREQTAAKSRSIVRRLLPVVSAAVAAAALIFFAFSFFLASHRLQTGFGEIAQQRLPDGSVVTLNAKSSIQWAKWNWEDNRELTLQGEAFFEVEKGNEFTVKTMHGEVEVLGTEFNVTVQDSYFEVTCFEGSVRVSGVEEVVLRPGEAYLEVEAISKTPAEVIGSKPSWTNDQPSFNNSPISQVLTALSNQYNLSFKGNLPVDSLRVTVSFPNDNEKLALDLVFKSIGRSYQRLPSGEVLIE